MSSRPLVSVVTPSLNQGAFVADASESVLEQDVSPVEHIVVEGGSTDATSTVLARYGHLRVLDRPPQGQSDAVNVGFAAAAADVLGWVNADDRYLPNVFRSVLRAFDENPDAGIVYGNCLEIDPAGRQIGLIRPGPYDRKRQLDGINAIPQPATFVRRSLLEEIGPLDPRLHYAMDYELWLRADEATRLVWVDEPWACLRLQPASKTATDWHRFYPEARRVARSHGGPFFSAAWRAQYGNTARLRWRIRQALP